MIIIFYISGLRRLEKPLLDFNMSISGTGISYFSHVAALPGGKAVISDDQVEVLMKNPQRKGTQVIYSCVKCRSDTFCVRCTITGLLFLGQHLYILHHNGTVLETRVSDWSVLSISTVPDVEYVLHTGSLSSKPDQIPDKETLLLCDIGKGEVVQFKPSTGQKKVRITGLNRPRSVSYFFKGNLTYYIICESGNHSINVYNTTWHLIRRIGRKGSYDGELNHPGAALVSDEGTIIILDQNNYRISEFSFDGTFLRQILDVSDDIGRPNYMSYYYPYLWLDNGNADLRRYKLY